MKRLYLSDRVIVMGTRPGHIKAVIDVPFDRPRATLTEMRGNPAFLQLRDHIWQQIRPNHKRCRDDCTRSRVRTARRGRYARAAQTPVDHHPGVLDHRRIWLLEIFGRQINPLFMSYPSKIFAGAITLTQDGVLQAALLESLRTLALGYVGGALVGVGAGLLVGRYREVEAATDWLINALYATPLVALIRSSSCGLVWVSKPSSSSCSCLLSSRCSSTRRSA